MDLSPRSESSAIFNVKDFGARGDGRALDSPGIQSAIHACGHVGGGTVFLPAGTYLTAALSLVSRVTLWIDAGATILGSTDPAHYPLIRSRWEGVDQDTHAPLIGGCGLEHVTVAGRGVVDGQGEAWWRRHQRGESPIPRPKLISFQDCRNVHISSITARNSPSWTISPLRCDDVTIEAVAIVNPADSPNTDGITPDSCRNVRISNCHIDVGDDCVSLKSGAQPGQHDSYRPCENITLTNCTMLHGHGGVVIGSEMSGDVRNVVIANCVFAGTDRGLRIKSRRGRGGVVENVQANNLVMEDVLCPIAVNLHYACGARGDETVSDRRARPVSEATPRIRHVRVGDVVARGVKVAAAFIFGLAEMPLQDLALHDISVSLSGRAEPDIPEMADGLQPTCRAGFHVHSVQRLRLHNIEVSEQLGAAFYLSDVSDVDLSACTTPTPQADSPVIELRDVRGAFVHGCRASTGTGPFLRVAGEASRDICLSGNDLKSADQAFTLDREVDPQTDTA